MMQALEFVYVLLLLGTWYPAFFGQQVQENENAWYTGADVEDAYTGEQKKIALTFDDGPSARYTPELLDGLKERDVKATFFLIGENIEKDDNALIVKRMEEEGHLIGNHTYTHVQLTSISESTALTELNRTNELLERITGRETEYVRPPFGDWPKALSDEVSMIPVGWTIDPLDWSVKNADEIVRKVVTEAEEDDIILMHDCYKTSVQAALRIIDVLQEEGFVFVTADEILLP